MATFDEDEEYLFSITANNESSTARNLALENMSPQTRAELEELYMSQRRLEKQRYLDLIESLKVKYNVSWIKWNWENDEPFPTIEEWLEEAKPQRMYYGKCPNCWRAGQLGTICKNHDGYNGRSGRPFGYVAMQSCNDSMVYNPLFIAQAANAEVQFSPRVDGIKMEEHIQTLYRCPPEFSQDHWHTLNDMS